MSHYSVKAVFPMQGGCPCGHVRYQIEKAPILVHCCHCTSCQRLTGSAFCINAIIESSLVTILPSTDVSDPHSRGKPASYHEKFAQLTLSEACCGFTSSKSSGSSGTQPTIPSVARTTLPAESTIGITVASCPRCHTGLWTHYCDAGLHTTYLRAGTLDEAHEIDPDVHIFTRSKRSFVSIEDGKPQFEWYYDDRANFIRDDCKERYEALKDVSGEYMAALKAALAK